MKNSVIASVLFGLFLLFFSSCIRLNPCGSPSSAQVLFSADFNNDNAGSPPAPAPPSLYGPPGASLEIGSSPGVLVVDSGIMGSKALRIQRSYPETTVTAIAGDAGNASSSHMLYFQYDACFEITPENINAAPWITVESDKGAIVLMTFHDNAYYYSNGSEFVKIEGNYDPYKEQGIYITVNLDTKKFDICMRSKSYIGTNVAISFRRIVANQNLLITDFTYCSSLKIMMYPSTLEGFQSVYVIDDIQIVK